jgi:hypothetical protein
VTRILAALLLACGILSCGGHEPSPGSDAAAPVTRLDAASLPALRDSFNAAVAQPRLLVMLSPT